GSPRAVRTLSAAADGSVASTTLRAPLTARADQRKRKPDAPRYGNAALNPRRPTRTSLAVLIDRSPGAQFASNRIVYGRSLFNKDGCGEKVDVRSAEADAVAELLRERRPHRRRRTHRLPDTERLQAVRVQPPQQLHHRAD